MAAAQNKKVLFLAAAIGAVIIVSFGFVFLNRQSQPAPTTATPQAKQPLRQPAGQSQPQPLPPGSYKTYSTAAVAEAEGRKVLFFHAPWCPQCRALEQGIQQGTIPAGMTIFKVDYDSSTALRQKYGVTIQTTIVEVDGNGKAIKEYVAYDSPSLDAVLKALGP